jgi:hypothetical protein
MPRAIGYDGSVGKASFVVAVMFAAATVAHAQPSQTAPIVAEPYVYLQGGLAIGGDGANGGVFIATMLEAGYRVGGNWWLRGEGLAGKSNDSTWGGPQYTGTIRQLRIGGEWHHRWLVMGLDIGVSHETELSDTDVRQPDHEYEGAMVALRIGGDFSLGIDHLRIRPGLELFGGGKLRDQPAIGGKDYQGGNTSVAVAYTW